MVVCSVRRRSYKRNRHHKYSCWRNPCVVFFLTFASIGSLRLFRVPARSKQLLIKSRESWRTRQQNKRNMFTYQLQMEQEEPQQRLRKYMAVRPNGTPVSVREWAAAVVQTSELSSPNHAIAGLESIFRSIPYSGVFFETPPVTKAVMDSQPFEFVLVDSPSLAKLDAPNPGPFREHFEKSANEPSVSFRNLSGSSLLVAPTPLSSTTAVSTHLITFMRTAPQSQVEAVWKMAAASLLTSVTEDKLWFSTSGLGVSWLHFRLDDTPKYYTYSPYRQA